jgi:cyclohexanone monooxygenase
LIVGAGFAGIYMLYSLRNLGMKAQVYEAGSGVGGTWYWNRYPGARCDTPSLQYSYSFSEPLQQEWNWTELYPAQPEIERYANHVVDRFDLRKDIVFGRQVTSAEFDEKRNCWLVETADGRITSATYCIMATGGYSIPVKGSIPGAESFRGELYYTATWPSEAVDFRGKRVGIIGTGSSGMQTASAVAEEPVDHLYVFQRTPNFLVPTRNKPMDPEYQRTYKETYGDRRERARHTPGGFDVQPIPPAPGPTRQLSEELFMERADTAWSLGGINAITSTFRDMANDEASNARVADYLRSQVRAAVDDSATAELLCAKDHYVGSRRMLVSDSYPEIFNQHSVSLVDVKSDPIVRISESGVVTAGGAYDLDILILATGFDSGSGAMLQVAFRGRGGEVLGEKWAGGPASYLGIGIEGFPNLFMIAQADSPGIRSLVLVSIEQHVEWITALIRYARDRGVVTIEPAVEAEEAWSRHVAETAERTLYFKDDTQFVGCNIPGKPRVYTAYVGGVGRYRSICDSVCANGYEGWVLKTPSGEVSGPRDWSGVTEEGTTQVAIVP